MKPTISSILVLLPLVSCSCSAQTQKASAPNLIFIMADQWRGDALGCMGKEPVQTPYIDQLASEGVFFKNAISNCPVSSPARAMLMTGMYPPSNKVVGNCNSDTAPYGVELSADARCWSDILKENDYHTGYVGKWHLDSPYRPYVDTYNNRGKTAWNEYCPQDRRHGFDFWVSYGTYDNHLKPMYWEGSAPRDSFFYVNQWGPEYEVDRAIEFLNKQKNSEKPFALVVSFNPPHTGYELVPDKYKEKYRNLDVEALCANRPDIPAKGTEMGDYFRNNIRNYYACITGVDENIGRLTAELKRLHLADNTIIVFTSDHGVCMGAHNLAGKDIFYNESMHIPLVISWPARLAPRIDNRTMIGFGDLYPTLLSLMGFRKDIPQEVQTYDLSHLLLSGEEDRELIQPYYYIQPDSPATGYRGLRTDKYTFAVHATDNKMDSIILFDRTNDPFEMENIASKSPELVTHFTRKLQEWLKATNDSFCLTHAQQIPVPKTMQLKWHEAELGAIFHYDLHVFDGIRYGQGNNRINPIEDYNIFNPEKLDTDQWIRAAKAAGCKFAVLTATHETGFGLWQSDVNPYCLKAVKWRDGKGDIVRDFVNSCRKYGIQPGIYVGIRWNSLLGIHNFKAEGEGEFARNRQAWYKRLCEKMVTELCTRYGELYMMWFDGGADDPRGDGPDVEPIVNRYQPNCLFYHNIDRADFRWGGSESGTVEYPCWSTFPVPCSHHKRIEDQTNLLNLLKHGDKEGKYWVPAMADTPLRGINGRHEWFWEPDDEKNIYSLNELMDKYEKSVGRNATLVLGLTPDPSGLLPAGDEQRLKEMGNEIKRRFSTPVATCKGNQEIIELHLSGKQPVNYCIIQENIKNGERVRKYKVEAKVNGKWLPVCNGESVGHKRIQKFTPVEATDFRLTLTEVIATPDITNFSLYYVSPLP